MLATNQPWSVTTLQVARRHRLEAPGGQGAPRTWDIWRPLPRSGRALASDPARSGRPLEHALEPEPWVTRYEVLLAG
jgi:hypothetical protein